jgi:hypothetical protein
MKCDIGDIVLVLHYKYPDGREGSLHSFVIMDINKDEFEIVNLDYLGFLISSNTAKGSDVNPNYPFNEPIEPTEENGLLTKSHVKCDILYDKIKEEDIIMRVGKVLPEQYMKFKELYKKSLEK